MQKKHLDYTVIEPSERNIPEEFHKSVKIISSDDVNNGGFIPPNKYYYVNAYGDNVYVKARSEVKAQSIVDGITGKIGFFKVRTSIKASVRQDEA